MSERRKHLEFLRKTARDAAWAGDYERALLLFEDGLGLARSWKDRELEDLFTCNRTMALIEMDREDFDLSRLKEIILRNPSGYNAVLASYVSATAHEARGEYARARFYAQSALTKGRELGLETTYDRLGLAKPVLLAREGQVRDRQPLALHRLRHRR